MGGPTFASLPVEITVYISESLSTICKTTLLNLRLTDRRTCSLVTPVAFRNLFLGAHDESPERFAQIALSDHLRKFVRELTCDTWIGPDLEHAFEQFRASLRVLFVTALPLIRYFTNLKSLRLRFSPWCPWEFDSLAQESCAFRLTVLDVVFTTLAGDWSAQEQQTLLEELETAGGYPDSVKAWDEDYDADKPTGPVHLERLTVYNLADDTWQWVLESKPLEKRLNMGTLTDLRLCITSEKPIDEIAWIGPQGNRNEIDELFDSLQHVWFSLPLAQNLKILSLSHHRYWG
ncbi:hypothetical protein N0V84_006522 [Fusarium piperis]|uniref:F-box domain-containing protein n=1 Tax=Fusarium piperis TaxID=1435070 RepID=A0A9W8WBU6_9HYPO|nr:hypothetical protein N0V84_006522 [Fusarium piperis]